MAYSKDNKTVIAWWSAGVTSAVAVKLALDAFGKDNVRIVYFKIDSAHPDNVRFKKECEQWYGKNIEVWQSQKYKDQFDVIEKTRYINGPTGARCTLELKKSVRFRVEKEIDYVHQVFGFEYSKKEINRAIRFLEQHPQAGAVFPLIENKMTKPECLHFLERSKIKRPRMYELGFANNNCIGCVKGGAGYWNLVRKEFPKYFDRMSKAEERIGATCLKESDGTRIPLKNLDPERGKNQEIIMPDCGNFCEIEFGEIDHKGLKDVFENPSVIKEFYPEKQEKYFDEGFNIANNNPHLSKSNIINKIKKDFSDSIHLNTIVNGALNYFSEKKRIQATNTGTLL